MHILEPHSRHQAGIGGRRIHGHTRPVWCGPPGVRAVRDTARGLLPTHFIKTHAEPAAAPAVECGWTGLQTRLEHQDQWSVPHLPPQPPALHRAAGEHTALEGTWV